jgi:hypothetical protein
MLRESIRPLFREGLRLRRRPEAVLPLDDCADKESARADE